MDTEKTFLKCGELEIGMDLRDWFAGQALPTVVQLAARDERMAGMDEDALHKWAAKIAYGAADAMMEARK